MRTQRGDRRVARQRALGAVSAAGAIALVLGTAGPAAASVDRDSGTREASARGQFLSGSIAGVSLDRIVALEPARAANSGSEPDRIVDNPLIVSALGASLITLPSGLQLDLGSIVDGGVAAQLARASADGSAAAGSGAIGRAGGASLGVTTSGAGGDLALDLSAALDGALSDAIADVELRLSAVQASARADADGVTGDYSLAGAELLISSPAVAALGQKVSSALDGVTSRLDDLSRDDGRLALSIGAALNPLLGTAGIAADVDIAIDADVRGAVTPLLRTKYAARGISIDLESGTVAVDLATLAGGRLNDLPPGADLLSAGVLSPVLDGATGSIADLVDQIVAAVDEALRSATISVSTSASALTAQAPRYESECRDITREIVRAPSGSGSGGSGSSGGSSGHGLVGGLLGGIGGLVGDVVGGVGDVVGEVVDTVTETVCRTVAVPLPDLATGLELTLTANLGQASDGIVDTSVASLVVLGSRVDVPVPAVRSALAAVITAELFGDDGAIRELQQRLQVTLIDPALEALLGADGASALGALLSVTVNEQEERAGGAGLTQTAARVTVGGEAGALIRLDVATAEVVGGVGGDDGPGESTDPEGPGGPGGPGTDDPATPAGFGVPGGPDRLAMTGVSALLAIIGLAAALLAASGLALRARRRSAELAA